VGQAADMPVRANAHPLMMLATDEYNNVHGDVASRQTDDAVLIYGFIKTLTSFKSFCRKASGPDSASFWALPSAQVTDCVRCYTDIEFLLEPTVSQPTLETPNARIGNGDSHLIIL